MDNTNFVQLLCLSIPIILMICAFLALIAFFIIRSIIRSSRRKLGLKKGTGKNFQKQLKKIETLLENDERQTAQWTRESQPLDLSIEPESNPIPDFSYEPEPATSGQESTVPQNCPACGAPVTPGSHSCTFCGSKF